MKKLDAIFWTIYSGAGIRIAAQGINDIRRSYTYRFWVKETKDVSFSEGLYDITNVIRGISPKAMIEFYDNKSYNGNIGLIVSNLTKKEREQLNKVLPEKEFVNFIY